MASIQHVRTSSISSTTAVANTASLFTDKAVANVALERTTSNTPGAAGPNVGHPEEQLEVEEAGTPEDNIVYPTGSKVWLTFACLCISTFLHGMDLTIIAVAVPSLTDHFKTIADIGWYSAAYGLVAASCIFFFGRSYTVLRTKHVYLFGLVVFECGSLLCTFAPTSKAFVVGRALSGFGACAFSSGNMIVLKNLFPLNKQAMMVGISGFSQALGLVASPLIGGLLIDAFSWRACFGINLPLGVMCIAFTAWAFEDPITLEDPNLPLRQVLKKLDLFSTLLVVPAIACLLMALQWGGIKYGWKDWRIILLFVIFAVLFPAFMYWQYRQGEEATVPIRIAKQRSLLGALWYCVCGNGVLGVTEYYISIYFQGVRGYNPTKSGLLGLPMIVGLLVSSLVAAAGVTAVGYYYPFMFATSVLAPIASGLLTTVDLDGSVVKPAALLGFLGAAMGLSIQVPALVLQATLNAKDVSIGYAMVGFGGGLGSALWICVSATLFQNRLDVEIMKYSPTSNATFIEGLGLSEIRNTIGEGNLRDVLSGYNEAVVQTLYVPLALTILTLIGSLSIERKSIKKKQS